MDVSQFSFSTQPKGRIVSTAMRADIDTTVIEAIAAYFGLRPVDVRFDYNGHMSSIAFRAHVARDAEARDGIHLGAFLAPDTRIELTPKQARDHLYLTVENGTVVRYLGVVIQTEPLSAPRTITSAAA